jgi:hypothetical protein
LGVIQDNEDLTRVGPGTVMGNFMRQYWIPAGRSSELKADGDPVRLMLLGEKLIAFRDSQGRVGVMITAVRTAAPRCFWGVTRKAAFAASITAGNLM